MKPDTIDYEEVGRRAVSAVHRFNEAYKSITTANNVSLHATNPIRYHKIKAEWIAAFDELFTEFPKYVRSILHENLL